MSRASLRTLDEFLQSTDPVVRAGGTSAAARLASEGALPRVAERIVEDGDSLVRKHAEEQLLRLDDSARQAAAGSLTGALRSSRAESDRAYESLAQLSRMGIRSRVAGVSLARRIQLATRALPISTGGTLAQRLAGFTSATIGAVVGTAIGVAVFVSIMGISGHRNEFELSVATVLFMPAFALIATLRSRPFGCHLFRGAGAVVEALRGVPEMLAIAILVSLASSSTSIAVVGVICISVAAAVRLATALAYDDSIDPIANSAWQIGVGTAAGVLVVAALAAPGALGFRSESRFWSVALDCWTYAWPIAAPLAVAFARIDGWGNAPTHLRGTRSTRRTPHGRQLGWGAALVAATLTIVLAGVIRTRTLERPRAINGGRLPVIARFDRLPVRIPFTISRDMDVGIWTYGGPDGSLFASATIDDSSARYLHGTEAESYHLRPGEYSEAITPRSDVGYPDESVLGIRMAASLYPGKRFMGRPLPTLLPVPLVAAIFQTHRSSDSVTIDAKPDSSRDAVIARAVSLIGSDAPLKNAADSVAKARSLIALLGPLAAWNQPWRGTLDILEIAQQLDQTLSIDWRSLCRNAAMNQLVLARDEDLRRCNAAVLHAGAIARGDRGILLARTGRRLGAIADLEAYVEWATSLKATPISARELAMRREWIAELRAGRYPITAEVFAEIRSYAPSPSKDRVSGAPPPCSARDFSVGPTCTWHGSRR